MSDRTAWPRLSSVVWVVVLITWPYILLVLCSIGLGIAKFLNPEPVS